MSHPVSCLAAQWRWLALLMLVCWTGWMETSQGQSSAFPTPLDYGALGDGVADDTLAVQAALDANASIYLSGGRYRITQALTLHSGVTVSGPGGFLVDFDSGDAGPANRAFSIQGDSVVLRGFSIEKAILDGSRAIGVFAGGRRNIVLQSLLIEGYSAGSGIRLENCDRFDIRDCEVRDFLVDAAVELEKEGCAGMAIVSCTDGLLQNNRIDRIEVGENARAFSGQGYRAANLSVVRSKRLAILGNRLSISGVGIDLASSEDCVVTGNLLQHHWFEGIRLTASKFCTLTGNRLSEGLKGIALYTSGEIQETSRCSPLQETSPLAIDALEGSVEGGIEDGATEGDDLTHLTDGNFNNRTLILQDGQPKFSFILDLQAEETLSDLTFVSEQNYRPGGQYLGGTVTLETATVLEGPYTLMTSEAFTCSRPPATQMIDETPSAPPTAGEARRVALPSPTLARYVRVASTFCLDNVILLSETLANHGPIVYRMRPLGGPFLSLPRLPVHMTDGDPATYFSPNIVSGTVDLDLGPYPAEIFSIRIVGRPGSLSGLPKTGEMRVSATDSPDNFDTPVLQFDQLESEGAIEIPFPNGIVKRFLRLSWESLQGPSDTRTFVAEIEVESGPPCRPSFLEAGPLAIGNVLNGNSILDTGAPSVFGAAATDRVADATATGIDLGARPLHLIVSDNLVADTQTNKTLVQGIHIPATASGNTVLDNVVVTELQQAPTPTATIAPTPTSTPGPPPLPSLWRTY